MIIKWNINQILSQCNSMYVAATDPYLTGYEQWPCKQDLYRVKFAVDEMLKNTSEFVGEEEWLRELEKEKVWKILKT